MAKISNYINKKIKDLFIFWTPSAESRINNENYIYIIDLLRGIAALAVVLVHFGGLGFLGESWITKIFYQGTYGVHIFFVISGFIIPWSLYHSKYKIENFFRFLAKRSLRIDPPYYLAVLLIVLQKYIVTLKPGFGGAEFELEPLRILFHFLYLIPFFDYKFYDPVFWTLAIEFQYYILIGIVFPLIIYSKKYINLLVLLLFLLSCFVPFKNNYLVFHYSPLFVSGILIFLFKVKKVTKQEFIIYSIICLLFCLFALNIAPTIAAILSIVCISLLSFRSIASDFLGKISYSLYLTHNFVRFFLFLIIKKLPITLTLFTKLVFLFVMIGIAIAFATIYYFFIERVAIKWSKKIVFKKSKEVEIIK